MTSFRPNWKIALFTVALLPVLIGFGFWQLGREQEKISLQQSFDQRSQAPWIELSAAGNTPADLSHRRVLLRGRFDPDRSFLLDNRLYQGLAGYEVIVPFLNADGRTVLVNRGWIAQGPTRDALPAIPAASGVTEVRGSIYVPAGEQFMLSNERESGIAEWPKVIQSLDGESLSSDLGMEIYPYTVRMEAGSPGALLAEWPLMNMMPEKHRAYAVQWFAMATALLLLFLYSTVKHPETRRPDADASDDAPDALSGDMTDHKKDPL
jgi:surfeit locus 1 family protein